MNYMKSCLIITMLLGVGYTQNTRFVSLSFENINIDAGTLDIFMTNIPGCSYCADPLFSMQIGCESYGNEGAGAEWIIDPYMTQSECTDLGQVTDGSGQDRGNWFDGHVSGFQFQLIGIEVTNATGGSAGETGFTILTGGTDVPSGISKVMGLSWTGATIQPGVDLLLISVEFTILTGDDNIIMTMCEDGTGWNCVEMPNIYDETGICFGQEISCFEDNGVPAASPNVISGSDGECLDVDWGECACSESNPADECGVCGGYGIADGTCDCDGNVDLGCGCFEPAPSGCDFACGSTLEWDECGVCGGDNSPDTGTCDCAGIPGGEAVFDDCGVCNGDNSSCNEGCGDMNNDGFYNVLDIVTLANCVLAGDCGS